MIDPTPLELDAMGHAAAMAGEVIDSYGKTDMAAWTEEQWTAFIRATCGGYVDFLVKRHYESAEALSRATGTLP